VRVSSLSANPRHAYATQAAFIAAMLDSLPESGALQLFGGGES
jgi:hypothetical protein